MIKKILYCASFLLALYSCNKTNVTLTGKIKGAANQKVYLEQQNVNQSIVIDSTKTNQSGEFQFKMQVESPTFFNVKIGPKEWITLIAEPDVKLELTGIYEGLHQNYWIDGSDNSLWIKLLNFQLHHTQMTMDSLQKKFQSIPQDEMHLQERLQVATAWDSIVRKQMEFSRDFILKHAISPAAYYALYQKFHTGDFILTPEIDFQSFKIVASSLKAMYPESQYTQAILNHLEQINKEKQNAQLRQLIANSENALPDIKLPNAQGDTVLFSSLKGKFIILDFALLNTKESQTYIENLKKVYQKYKNRGVVVYQVCLDTDPEIWKNLVHRYGIEWTCVRDASGYSSKVWNLQNIPTNYIINPKFEIVGKNLQGKRLEERLTDLLK